MQEEKNLMLKDSKKYKFCFSIVSHGQANLVHLLLNDIRTLELSDIEIIITINIPEDESVYLNLSFPTKIIRNKIPIGFGENHNNAFKKSSADFFVVINPDIRLPYLNMEEFLELAKSSNIGAMAPVVKNNQGNLEDSVRSFPTILSLLHRIVFRNRIPDYHWDKQPIDIDWAGGMFLVLRREAYHAVHGFDQHRFFMYFEDIDICRRLQQQGWRVVLQPSVTVIHNAQRASHRNWKHLRWHLTSAFRYFSGL